MGKDKEVWYPKLGELLRKRREQSGKTQEEVARILGVGRETMYFLEKGCNDQLHLIFPLLRLYDITMEEFLGTTCSIYSEEREQSKRKKVYHNTSFDHAEEKRLKLYEQALDAAVQQIDETWKLAIDTWELGKEEGVEEIPHE